MGLFNRGGGQEPPAQRPPAAGQFALAQQLQQQAVQMQQQLQAMHSQAMQQAAAFQQAAQSAQPGQAGAPGPASWARQVLAILAPPQPGYVKRCQCVVCGAPKKLPTVTAYVYCDCATPAA